jgi:membrane-bound inhibitor of C-type lysozyme
MRAFLLLLALCAGAALAQDNVRIERVTFAEGETSKSIKDTVHGDEAVDHRVQGHTGQVMTVRLDTKDAYFNVIAPGAGDVAVYNSSMDMNTWTGSLMKDGEYTVRVYQKSAKGGITPYTMRITLHSPGGKPVAAPPATKPSAMPPATADGPSNDDLGLGMTTHYACDGLSVATTQRKSSGDLVVEVRGRVLTLPQSKGASGAKYEDAKGNAFSTKDKEATLTLAGERARRCAQA